MPFLVAIHSPNRSIQRRIASAGGIVSSRSRAPALSLAATVSSWSRLRAASASRVYGPPRNGA